MSRKHITSNTGARKAAHDIAMQQLLLEQETEYNEET